MTKLRIRPKSLLELVSVRKVRSQQLQAAKNLDQKTTSYRPMRSQTKNWRIRRRFQDFTIS